MAKLKVAHRAAILSTELDVKDIKKAMALVPSTLQIKDAEGNVIFTVAVGNTPAVSKHGIVFKENKITNVLTVETVSQDSVEEEFGNILLQLEKVEEQVADALADFATDVADMITFDQE